MKTQIVVMSLLLGLLACQSDETEAPKEKKKPPDQEVVFDPVKWKTKKGEEYPYRAQMLNDIVYNDTVRSLAMAALLDLLGKPDRINENHFYYLISQKRLGQWPLGTTSMVVKFSMEKDSIEWIKIHE